MNDHVPNTSAPSLTDDLASLFSRRLVIVSGKGGVGKTTTAAALSLLAARSGKRVLLLATDGRGDAAALFGQKDAGYREVALAPGLFTLTADFDPLLSDYVHSTVPTKLLGDKIMSSGTFRYFTRATPGLPDLLLLGKVRTLLKRPKEHADGSRYDLIVIDAPATGHALSLVGMPRTLLGAVAAGPLRKVAADLDVLLADARAAALVVVAEPAEFAAREAEELIAGARKKAGLVTRLLIVNREGRLANGVGNGPRPRVSVPVVTVPEIEDPADPASQEAGFDPERGFFEEFVACLAGEPVHRAPRRATRREALPDTLDLVPLLSRARILVLMGPGGVGKTTLAAAAGLAGARLGRRVLVLTVDPARRLAQALSLDERPDQESGPGREDAPVEVRHADIPAGARLSAMQIHPMASFERLLRRIAPPETMRRIRANKLFSELADSLPGVLEYLGVEALAEFSRGGDYDLIVLDTPPAARGLDFLSAPDRVVNLLEHDALRWFLDDDSLLGRALSGTARGAAALLKLADRVLGLALLSDLSDFFRAFGGLYEGFKERSREISKELRIANFLLVSTLDRSALRTAVELEAALCERERDLAFLLNRVTPSRSLALLPPGLSALPMKILMESGTATADLPTVLADRLLRVEPA